MSKTDTRTKHRFDPITQRVREWDEKQKCFVPDSLKTDRPSPFATLPLGRSSSSPTLALSTMSGSVDTLPLLLVPEGITLSWQCHAKVLALRDTHPNTEVGWHFLNDPDKPLRFIDVIVPKQTVSGATVNFDAESKADIMADLFSKNIGPDRWLPWWGHSHPGPNAGPSGTDHSTFNTTYNQPKLALMFIIGKGSNAETTAHLRINNPPYTTGPLTAKVSYEPSPILTANGLLGKAATMEEKRLAFLAIAAANTEVATFIETILIPWLASVTPGVSTGNYSSPFVAGGTTGDPPSGPWHIDGETAHDWYRRNKPNFAITDGVKYGLWKYSKARDGWVHEGGTFVGYFTNIHNIDGYVSTSSVANDLPAKARNGSHLVELAEELFDLSPPHHEGDNFIKQSFEWYLSEYNKLDSADKAIVDGLLRERHGAKVSGDLLLFGV